MFAAVGALDAGAEPRLIALRLRQSAPDEDSPPRPSWTITATLGGYSAWKRTPDGRSLDAIFAADPETLEIALDVRDDATKETTHAPT